jgi:6-phosphogluconolactonase (cycloisomerase 2 family)
MLALYGAVDEELTHYEVDVDGAALVRRKTIEAPAHVQYAWPHPSRRWLYVATSNRGPGLKADRNHVSAYRIDPASGALTPHGEPHALRARAVHICVHPQGTQVYSAHNLPRPGITVTRINADGTLGPEVAQPADLAYGNYPHQVMITPSGRAVILVDRGNDAAAGKPEDPGALRIFRNEDGVLSPLAAIAPEGGYGFGPRHLDFHPAAPWLYVSLERQSKLHMYRMTGDGIEPAAAYVRDTLADPAAYARRRQLAGAIHVHPNGRVVYLVNRADATVDYEGTQVYGGGENSIVVYALDAETGAPTLIQRADPHSLHVRTFAIDPGGRLLVAASIKPLAVRAGKKVTTVPAALTLFRIAGDGKLEFARKYDVETGAKTQYWIGMVQPGNES